MKVNVETARAQNFKDLRVPVPFPDEYGNLAW